MRLPKKDIIATCAVVGAVALYLLWVADTTLPGMSSLRITALAVLVLGFVASAVAVVPSFDRLLHGNKVYLAATSTIGLAALVAGAVALWSASSTALGLLMAALAVLWLVSTSHHAMLGQDRASPPPEETEPAEDRTRVHAAMR